MIPVSLTRRISFGMIAFLSIIAISGDAAAQTSRVQVIHNAPDPTVRWLDLYVDNALVDDSLLFRIATPFIELTSGNVLAGLAPAGSAGPQDIFASSSILMEGGKDYVLVISGVFDPSRFKPNPEGAPIGLSVQIYEVKAEASQPLQADILFINGTPDAPALTFSPVNEPPLARQVAYGTASGYAPSDDFVYTMAMGPSSSEAIVFSFFDLNVGFLQGKAFTVLTSGFLDKFSSRGGPVVKLLVVTSDSRVFSLAAAAPPDDYATMQIVNNSGDIDHHNGFDIIIDGGTIADNLLLRNATPRLGLVKNRTLSIQVTDSTGSVVLGTSILSTEPGANYLLMISGVVNTANYAPNPDGRPISLRTDINPNIRLTPDFLGTGEFVFANGITDAPSLDLEATSMDPVMGLPFGQMSGYNSINVTAPLIEAFPSDSPLPAIISNLADLPFLLGKTFVLFSTGFDNPAANRGGIKAQFMVALQDGLTVDVGGREIPRPFSRLQLIHASSDPALRNVDLYADQYLVGDDTEARSGTEFFDIFSEKTVTIGLAPQGSSSFRDVATSYRLKFPANSTSTAVISGLFNPESFVANPDGEPTSATLNIIDDVLESGPDASRVTLLIGNAMTDAPAANVIVDRSFPFTSNLRYGQSSSYGVLAAAEHSLDFVDAATNQRIGNSFVDFRQLRGQSGILFAAGFVDTTAANGNGPSFSTFIVTGDGTTIQFDRKNTDTESDLLELPQALAVSGTFPNPFGNRAQIVFDLPANAQVRLELVDATGRVVRRQTAGAVQAGTGRTLDIDGSQLPSGIYFYRLLAESGTDAWVARGRIMVVH